MVLCWDRIRLLPAAREAIIARNLADLVNAAHDIHDFHDMVPESLFGGPG